MKYKAFTTLLMTTFCCMGLHVQAEKDEKEAPYEQLQTVKATDITMFTAKLVGFITGIDTTN